MPSIRGIWNDDDYEPCAWARSIDRGDSMNKKNSNFERYMNTYAGQHIPKADLDRVAVWEIRGEDPNCDLGGAHYQPHLGTVQGKLRDVIMYAVDLPGFWQWGGGGDFKEVKIQTLTDMAKRADLLKEKAALEARLKEIDKSLK